MNNKDKMLWIRRIAIFIVLMIALQLATLSGGSVVITALIVGIFFIILFPKLRKVIGERWE